MTTSLPSSRAGIDSDWTRLGVVMFWRVRAASRRALTAPSANVFKRKLQGASLFFLFAAIYWALFETGREDPSGRRTGASEQVYGFPQGRVVPIGADYDADAVRFRADMATGALERAARVPSLVRARRTMAAI